MPPGNRCRAIAVWRQSRLFELRVYCIGLIVISRMIIFDVHP